MTMLNTFAAAATLFASLAAVPAAAQNVDVFIGGLRDDVRPIVAFALDDSTEPGFRPTNVLGVFANDEYEFVPGQPMNPVEACRSTPNLVVPVDIVYELDAVYGPSSTQEPINFPDLPTYFAQQSMLMMLERGLVVQGTPEFGLLASCVGYVWAQRLSQPAEVWEEIIDEHFPQLRGVLQVE